MLKRYKSKGVAMVGTVAALVAWILLSYGIFTVEGSQFQMLISSNQSLNAQKLAEIDAALIKMVNYEEVTNSSALGKVNLHLGRDNLKSISDADGWQDEIIISNEKIKGNDPDHGRFRVATINIYREGDTEPRFSMQVPVTKSGQTYSRKTIDDFIEELKKKDKELEEKDKQLEAKDKELEAADQKIASRIASMRSSLMSEIQSSKCTCSRPTEVVTIVDPKPSDSEDLAGGGGSGDSGAAGNAGDPAEENVGGGGSGGGSGDNVDEGSGTGGNDNYSEQDVWEIDAWDAFDINKSFTAPCDGYIKIIGLAKEDDMETYWGEYFSMGVGSHSLSSNWSSDGDGYYQAVESYAYLIDGLLVDGSTTSSSYPYIHEGTQTYDGKTLRTYTESQSDGEGGWIDVEIAPTGYSMPALYGNQGISISKGSTFSLHHDASSTTVGDASGNTHWHYKVVFIPKTS